MATILIRNNSARVHGIGRSLRKDSKGVETNSEVVLLPGVNKVDAQAWENAKKIKVIRHLIEDEVTESGRPVLEEMMNLGKKALKDVSVADAKKLISETFDRDLLTEWEKGDKREEVGKAIEAQREVLRKAAREPEKGDEKSQQASAAAKVERTK